MPQNFAHRADKFELQVKSIVPSESTAEEVSFEWSHLRISSINSKVRNTD